MSRAGSVQRDASGRWTFVLDVTPRGSSKRQQIRRRGFVTKRDALRSLDEVKSQLRSSTYVEPSKQTIAEFLNEWLLTMEATVRESTAFSYRRNMQIHVVPRIGHLPLHAIDAGVLNRLYRELLLPGASPTMTRGLSPRTVAYIATILKRSFRDAVRWGRLASNPADRADAPKAGRNERREIQTWSAETLSEFLTRCEAEGDGDAALWRFIASTGTRRGEALGLRWRDVDLTARTATICQTVVVTNHRAYVSTPKTTMGLRTIDIDEFTATALRSHRARQREHRLLVGPTWQDGDYVFADIEGGFIHPEAISKRFDRRVRHYRLPIISLHALRHTWATLALRAGVHPKVVQERLGHSTVAITLEIYSHVTEGLGRDAADRVASLFN